FFFFQAEDGIRDLYVTGVQTCALPICTILDRLLALNHQRYADEVKAGLHDKKSSKTKKPKAKRAPVGQPTEKEFQFEPGMALPRSEERRVGKECRSRRSQKW